MVVADLDRRVELVEAFLSVISWIATLFITFLIIIDVFLRFVFNAPLPATWEMSEVVMPYIVFFAFSYTLKKDAHVRVTIFVERLPQNARFWCEVLRKILSFGMCALFAYWSWLRFWDSYIIREEILAAIYIPWFVGKFAMPIGMGIFAIRYFLQALQDLSEHQW
jgi:TRAP-type C4-dicarboxylate transport system permease small subunit